MLYFPEDNVVSIGENSWNILYISERDEETVIRQFMSNGAVHHEKYEQSDEQSSHFMTALSNLRNMFVVSPPVANWEKGIFSCLAWNSLGTKLALCFVDSSIHIYNIIKQTWEDAVISNTNINGIRQLCWKPGCRDTIAVASRNGVYVWSTVGDFESQSFTEVSNLSNILSVQYSPNGEYLCVIRKDDHRVYLYSTYDYQLMNTVGSVAFLPRKILFSPDSQLLVVLSEKNISIYNTISLKHEDWAMANVVRVVDCCFSASSEYLYVACESETSTILHILQLSHRYNMLYTSISTSIVNLSEQLARFGKLLEIAVDPRGSRLICRYENSNLLPVFGIERETRFFLIGFLNNPVEGNSVMEMGFAPWGRRGSLLSVIWKKGQLLFYHLCY